MAKEEQGTPTISKVLVVGYYGFRNMGDEAVLTSMITDLRSCPPSSHSELL